MDSWISIVGWVLFVGGLLLSSVVRLYQDLLFWFWFAKFVPEQVKERLTSGQFPNSAGQDFFKGIFWIFSSPQNPPDKVFQPIILLITPIALSVVSFCAAGLFLIVIPSVQNLFIAFAFLALALFGCYRLAVWQVKNNRW